MKTLMSIGRCLGCGKDETRPTDNWRQSSGVPPNCKQCGAVLCRIHNYPRGQHRKKKKKRRSSLKTHVQCDRERISKSHNSIRQQTLQLVTSGQLIDPGFCEFCNTSHKLEWHHLNYLSPTNVIRLCRSCHVDAHGWKCDPFL